MTNFRKALKIFAVFVVVIANLSFASKAHAQLAAYTTISNWNRETNETNQNNNFTSMGLGAGVYYDGHRFDAGRLALGIDMRGSLASNDQFGLVGMRVAKHSRETLGPETFKPYAEVLLGGGVTPDSSGDREAHMIYQFVGGIDVTLGKVDFRLLEVGFGKTPFNNSTVTGYTAGDLWLVSESTGLVFHF